MKKYIAILFLSVMLAGCGDKNQYDATGIFEATTVTVSAETSGKILSMSVSEGDSVVLNQKIAEIDSVLFSLELRQLKSRQQSVEKSSPDIAAQAASLRTQIAHQKQECERYRRLLDDGATTQKNYDDAVAMLKTLEGQLEALLSTLSKNKSSISEDALSIQYQADRIEEQIDKCTIHSPISGTVLIKYAEPGEYATPGKPLYKLADLNNIYIRSYFTCNQLAEIKIGQEVTVIADFGGNKEYEYPGVITWIAEESEFTPKTIQTKDSRANLVYAVKVAVKNDGRLKLGQYGYVNLHP